MINKILNYILSGVILILLTLLLIQGCSKKKVETALAKKSLEYSILSNKWNILINTPPKITIVEKPVEVHNNNPIVPKPLPNDNNTPGVPPSASAANCDSVCEENRYQETYSIGDSIRVLWVAKARGYIKEFNILKVGYPYREKLIERFVPCDPVDTLAIIQSKCKVKNELWLYAKPQFVPYPFEFTSATAGVQWQIKKKWGIGAGAGYSLKMDSFIVEGVLLFNLK